VTAGTHDPDWGRQFGAGDESPEFKEYLFQFHLLGKLIPCPYREWCQNRHGKLCDNCNGLGRLAFLADATPMPGTSEGRCQAETRP
jgi:hypothetical protein